MNDFFKTERLTNFSYAPLANSLVCGARTFLGLRYSRNGVECITSKASYPWATIGEWAYNRREER